MGLESTYICVDASEYQRNGDFGPTRLQAEKDAVNLVSQVKLRSHPENNVGLISVADQVSVLSTLTQDQSKLYMKLHQIRPEGLPSFATAIKIANLALKHRPSKNHRPRIILFVGSPIKEAKAELVQLAKKLRKEKVAVDAVLYGETGGEGDEGNQAKLQAVIDTLNGQDGTSNHLVVVAAGASLQEALGSSAVCRGEDGSGPAVGVGGMGGDFDPNDDPELAMALRVSLEEQRQRQEGQPAAGEAAGGGAAAAPAAPAAAPAAAAPAAVPFEAMTEEEQLEYALRMSMQEGAGEEAGGEKMEVEEKREDEKTAKLQAVIDTLNGQDGTSNHLVVVAAGASLQEALGSSAVCRGEDGSGPAVGVGGMGGDFDPNDDPELAMALRVSLEEQRQRQEGQPAAGEAAGGGAAAAPAAPAAAPAAAAPAAVPFEAMTEEEQLEYALRMSMQEGAGEEAGGEKMEVEEAGGSGGGSGMAELLTDPAALQALVSGLPGVDPNSAAIQKAVTDAKDAKDAKPKDPKDKDPKPPASK